MSFLFGREGFLTKIAGGYGVYFRRNFHPADMDESCYIAEFEERYGMHLSHLPAP
jgi:predicted metal-dependent hydrolase